MNDILEFNNEYLFLSNFYESTIVYKEIEYPSVEHYYQAAKTLDRDKKIKMSLLDSPRLAKKAGRDLDKSNETRKDWQSVKVEVMKRGLKLKFQNTILKEKLLATGDAILEEGNWWGDSFWGVDLKTREGRNELGNLLMELRNQLKNE